jgi:lysophospholipase L1-like esterase
VIFAYSFEDPRVTAILRSIPGAVIAPPVSFDDAHYLPDDGHPTAAGNDLFAKRIARAVDPAWLTAPPR